MSGRILIDTNIFIYLTKGDENVIEFIQNKNIFVSFITELEQMKTGQDITIKQSQIFFQNFHLLSLE